VRSVSGNADKIVHFAHIFAHAPSFSMGPSRHQSACSGWALCEGVSLAPAWRLSVEFRGAEFRGAVRARARAEYLESKKGLAEFVRQLGAFPL
jgi:hypothetical protein